METMAKVIRESKNQFWQRINQEGREPEARAAEAELLRQGFSRRHVQKVLVSQFQPVDGRSTSAWQTPNSWECGRRKLSPAERYENDLEWAHKHIGRVRPEDAPTAQKRSLLLLAEKNLSDFHRRYHKALPNITRRQEAKEEEHRRRIEAQDEEQRHRLREQQWKRQQAERAEQERKDRQASRKRAWRLKKQQEKDAKERAEQEQRRQQAEREQRTAKTLEILRERRTKMETLIEDVAGQDGLVGRGVAEYPVAAWPVNPDQAVVSSPEAIDWQKQLDAAKIAAKEKARRLADEDLKKRIEETEERQRQYAEQERLRKIRQLSDQKRRLEANLDHLWTRPESYLSELNELKETVRQLDCLLTSEEKASRQLVPNIVLWNLGAV
jgi:hypothetical protein